MLTERQAWLELAKAFDAASETGGALIGQWATSYVCVAILHLGKARMIDSDTILNMDDRAWKNRPRGAIGGCAWWSPGNTKPRAAFCRKMAALCKPAKKPAKKRLVKAAK